jgi:hypothetical protein
MLNAGLAIAVQGATLPRIANGSYAGSLPDGTLLPGTVNVQGGRLGVDVGSFQKAITIPQPIAWTNIADIAGTTISRGQALKVNWSGGNDTSEFVIVRGISTTQGGDIRGSFTCTATPSAGTLSVSADVLYALPAGNQVGSDFIEVGTATRLDTSRFDASGLDGGYVQVRRFQRASVAFQ